MTFFMSGKQHGSRGLCQLAAEAHWSDITTRLSQLAVGAAVTDHGAPRIFRRWRRPPAVRWHDTNGVIPFQSDSSVPSSSRR